MVGQDAQRKERSTMLFNALTKNEHGKHGSDIKHLIGIGAEELVALLKAGSLSPLARDLLDCVRFLHVISWKIDPVDCERAINLERGKFSKALGKKIDAEDYRSALKAIRERLQVGWSQSDPSWEHPKWIGSKVSQLALENPESGFLNISDPGPA